MPSDTTGKPTTARFCGCPQDGWHTEVWRANVVDAFKSNNVSPVSDTNTDCCFIAAHDELAESHHVRGSSWADVIGDSKEKWLEFSKKVQCKATSHDVHWPMTCSIRSQAQSSGFRKRSAKANAKRMADKKAKVHSYC